MYLSFFLFNHFKIIVVFSNYLLAKTLSWHFIYYLDSWESGENLLMFSFYTGYLLFISWTVFCIFSTCKEEMICQIQENFIQERIKLICKIPHSCNCMRGIVTVQLAELGIGICYKNFQPDSSAFLLHYQHFFSRFGFHF